MGRTHGPPRRNARGTARIERLKDMPAPEPEPAAAGQARKGGRAGVFFP